MSDSITDTILAVIIGLLLVIIAFFVIGLAAHWFDLLQIERDLARIENGLKPLHEVLEAAK